MMGGLSVLSSAELKSYWRDRKETGASGVGDGEGKVRVERMLTHVDWGATEEEDASLGPFESCGTLGHSNHRNRRIYTKRQDTRYRDVVQVQYRRAGRWCGIRARQQLVNDREYRFIILEQLYSQLMNASSKC